MQFSLLTEWSRPSLIREGCWTCHGGFICLLFKFKLLKLQWQCSMLITVRLKHLKVITFCRDGGLKRQKVKDFYKEEQQKMYSSIIVGQNGTSPNRCCENTEDTGDSGLLPWSHGCWCDWKLCPIFLHFNLNVFYELLKTDLHPRTASRGQHMTTQSPCSSSSSSSSFLPMWQCVFYV